MNSSQQSHVEHHNMIPLNDIHQILTTEAQEQCFLIPFSTTEAQEQCFLIPLKSSIETQNHHVVIPFDVEHQIPTDTLPCTEHASLINPSDKNKTFLCIDEKNADKSDTSHVNVAQIHNPQNTMSHNEHHQKQLEACWGSFKNIVYSFAMFVVFIFIFVPLYLIFECVKNILYVVFCCCLCDDEN